MSIDKNNIADSISNSIEGNRKAIDKIDDELTSLYINRLELAKKIGEEKERLGVAIENTLREKAVVNRVTADVPDGLKLYVKQFFDTLFSTSKAYQSQTSSAVSPIKNEITRVLNSGKQQFPVSATVACQGVPGAYSQLAADRLFAISDITYLKDWDAVFNAVEKGLCSYGVLPIENSTVGSVDGVYDLMRKHNCFIVRSIKLRIQHYLLARHGASVGGIKEIFSHEQALGQCAEYLKAFKDVKITVFDNTAHAAKAVADSGRTDVACIASRSCAGIYGLDVLAPNIQDNESNYTRFIAISKRMQIFDGADKISIMVNLPHEVGSLNKLLNRFSALELNLTKLESRPLSNTSFEFAFYFDFDAAVERPEVQNLMAELENTCDRFVFLGSYSEII